MIGLYRQAVSDGIVPDSEHDRLQFVAAAHHACVKVDRDGQGDPCSLFAYIVNKGRWLLIDQQDEDAARMRLKVHLHGVMPRRRTGEDEMDLIE